MVYPCDHRTAPGTFDGGILTQRWQDAIVLQADELAGWQFVDVADLAAFLPPRLSRRINSAVTARAQGRQAYLEHGAGNASSQVTALIDKGKRITSCPCSLSPYAVGRSPARVGCRPRCAEGPALSPRVGPPNRGR